MATSIFFSLSLSLYRRNKALEKRKESRDWFNFRISEIAKGITTHAARIRRWSKSKDIFRSNFWCSLSVRESYSCYRESTIVLVSILFLINFLAFCHVTRYDYSWKYNSLHEAQLMTCELINNCLEKQFFRG